MSAFFTSAFFTKKVFFSKWPPSFEPMSTSHDLFQCFSAHSKTPRRLTARFVCYFFILLFRQEPYICSNHLVLFRITDGFRCAPRLLPRTSSVGKKNKTHRMYYWKGWLLNCCYRRWYYYLPQVVFILNCKHRRWYYYSSHVTRSAA